MSEHLDESVNREIDDYIAKCRAMHKSKVAPAPRFAHAVSALADERDTLLDRVASLERAMWEACDAFRVKHHDAVPLVVLHVRRAVVLVVHVEPSTHKPVLLARLRKRRRRPGSSH